MADALAALLDGDAPSTGDVKLKCRLVCKETGYRLPEKEDSVRLPVYLAFIHVLGSR